MYIVFEARRLAARLLAVHCISVFNTRSVDDMKRCTGPNAASYSFDSSLPSQCTAFHTLIQKRIFTERALHVPTNYPDDSPTRILPFESSI